MKRAWLLLTAALAVALAACSGVPSSSAPETVQALDTGGASGAPSTNAPNLGGDPRLIVGSFLAENATTSLTHTLARAYLTNAANNRWSDNMATIIEDETTSTFDTSRHTVTVYGKVLGTLSNSGVYSPALQGGQPQPFVFHFVQLPDKQWRIDRLHAGLLLSDEDFRNIYRQQVLYFYDLSEQSLVPDLRWSALDDRVQWSEWLLRQLADGPRPDLANAVSPDTMPANIDPTSIQVTLGTPTLIDIPGSSQLDPGVRDRLAAQVSLTLIDALSGREIRILDGTEPVVIPAVGGTTFSASDFSSATGPANPSPAVYYLSGGRIRDEAGRPLAGPLGEGRQYYLASFALGQPQPAGPVYAAGVTETGGKEHLLVGTTRSGVRQTSVEGTLSRPAFAPGTSEVWIGAGSTLYRVDAATSSPRAYPVPIVSGGGRILALRFSPEGSRIALVIGGANGEGQLYVGAVVRGSGQVRVDGLQQISPTGLVVTDVAWLDSFKLFAIGYVAGSGDSRTYETGADGTDWTTSTLGNLPTQRGPDAVTAATAANVWVSASGYIWQLSGTSWVSPGTTGQTPGTAPVYLE
jgi:Lipoprotein LpqB beta-propeller domain